MGLNVIPAAPSATPIKTDSGTNHYGLKFSVEEMRQGRQDGPALQAIKLPQLTHRYLTWCGK